MTDQQLVALRAFFLRNNNMDLARHCSLALRGNEDSVVICKAERNKNLGKYNET